MENIEYRMPTWLAAYYVNDDCSHMNDDEIKQADHFLTSNNIRCIDVKDDSSFYHTNDFNTLGDNCSTFVFKKVN